MSAASNLTTPIEISSAAVPVPTAQGTEFRSRMGRISRQSLVYFSGTILTAAAGYFFRIYLARTLGAEALGIYALGMSIVGFLALFNAFGFPAAAARFIAEYSSRGEYARLGSFLRGSLGLLATGNLLLVVVLVAGGPWVAVHFYHSPALSAYFWPFALIMVLGVFTNFLGQAMAGYQDVGRRTLITHFLGTPLNIVISVILISVGFGLAGYLTAQIVSAIVVTGLLAVSIWKMTPVQARRTGEFTRVEKQVVLFSGAAFAIATVDFVLSQADKIVLGHYLEARQVGIYAVASAMVGFVPIALQSVNQIFSPNIAELHALGNHTLLQKLYSTLTKWVLVLTLPLGLAIIVLSRPLMGIFGGVFVAGAAVLVIGTVGQLFNCAVGSVGFLLLMSGHQMEVVKIQAANALMIIGLSVLLVPRFGIVGAAVASAVSVTGTNVWSLYSVFKRLRLFPYESSYWQLVLPTAISGGILWLLTHFWRPNHSWQIAAAGLVGSYISFLGVFLLVGLNDEDRKLARAAWEKIGFNFRTIGAPIQ